MTAFLIYVSLSSSRKLGPVTDRRDLQTFSPISLNNMEQGTIFIMKTAVLSYRLNMLSILNEGMYTGWYEGRV